MLWEVRGRGLFRKSALAVPGDVFVVSAGRLDKPCGVTLSAEGAPAGPKDGS